MNHTLVDRCFERFKDYITSRSSSPLESLKKRFMVEVKKEFSDGIVEIRKRTDSTKYSFNDLVPFLDFCELGQWANAREKFEEAFKQYQTFVYVLDTLNRNEKELPKPDTSLATTNSSTHAKNSTDSNKSRKSRFSLESPIGGQSAAQAPRDKSQIPLKHTPDKTLSTSKTAATLLNQGRSVQKTSRNTDEHDSRNYKGTQLYHSEYHKGKNQYSMTSDNNDKSTWQKATAVSPMKKGLPVPEYHTNSEFSKSSIEEPEKALLLRVSTVSPRDQHSLVHDRRNKSDHTNRGELPKTERDSNQVDIYRRSENAIILLRDNNPNIADLSDTNHPTKLAERFSELHSNEHADIFEELATWHQEGPIGENQEKEIATDLLCVVKDNIRTHVEPGDARKASIQDDTTKSTASKHQPVSKVTAGILQRDQAKPQVRTDQKQDLSQHIDYQVSVTSGDTKLSKNQRKSASSRPRDTVEDFSPM